MFPKGKRIPLFLALVALFWFSLYTYSPIFTVYIKEFSTTQMAGTIIASYGFVQMCLRIPVGILSDKIKNRKIFITIGLVASGVSALGLALFKAPVPALVFRGLTGLTAATWVPFSILYSSYYDKQQAARAIGVANAFNFGGQMIATLIGGFLPDWTNSYAPSFYLAVAAAAAGVVLSFFVVDQEKKDFPERPVKVRELSRRGEEPDASDRLRACDCGAVLLVCDRLRLHADVRPRKRRRDRVAAWDHDDARHAARDLRRADVFVDLQKARRVRQVDAARVCDLGGVSAGVCAVHQQHLRLLCRRSLFSALRAAAPRA